MREILETKNLKVQFNMSDGMVHAVNDVSLIIREGETLGLVGETGAGKTTTALAIQKLILQPPGEYAAGEILYEGEDILKMSDKNIRKIRGKQISMIFQDPMTSLDPVMKVIDQVAEVIRLHNKCSVKESVKRAGEMFEMMGIPASRGGDYPHQFSGGMKQRVIIATALANSPRLLIADEPTTALDVTIQAQILEIIRKIKDDLGTSMLLITHDLGIVAENCDRVAIMYAGEIVEQGELDQVFKNPGHPYTVGLFNAIPSLDKKVRRLSPIDGLMPDPTALPDGCYFSPRCPLADETCRQTHPALSETDAGHAVRCFKAGMLKTDMAQAKPEVIFEKKVHEDNNELLRVSHLKKYFPTPMGQLHAVDDVSFSLAKGRVLGVVGESGCGKSTLGRTVLGLLDPTDGQIFYDGRDITHLKGDGRVVLQRKMQIIFQDPFSSLNPRMNVWDLIADPLQANRLGLSKKDLTKLVWELMDTVGLARRLTYSYPHELDGGRRQRIGVARALALNPDFIVCDEPVSALDVSIQAQILNLLQDLQEEKNLTYIFVTHDLSVVKHISDAIMVMYVGCMVEMSPADELFAKPLHPYTKGLLAAIPVPFPDAKRSPIIMQGELSTPVEPKPGCRFAPRCPWVKDVCTLESPPYEEVLPNHFVACHFAREKNDLQE
jgi:peptide/nickel transport system ATP-binding protein